MAIRNTAPRLLTIGLCFVALSGCLDDVKDEAVALAEAASDDGDDDGNSGGGGNGNLAPMIEGEPSTSAMQGELFEFAPEASDPDGDAVTFGADGKPEWLGLDTGTGLLSGIPGDADVGTYNGITIWVTDGDATTELEPFDLTVMPLEPAGNTPPTIDGDPATSVEVGEEYRFEPDADDADADDLTFWIFNRPAWASFSRDTGVLQGMPPSGSERTYENVMIWVRDGQANASLPPFDIEVTSSDPGPAPNAEPEISGDPSDSVEAGRFYSFRPTATDDDDDQLAFAIDNQPPWAGFNPGTGRLWGFPDEDDVGTFDGIVISVSDGVASDSLGPFSVTVIETADDNEPPTISGAPPPDATEGVEYAFLPTAGDPDEDELTFSIANRPGWAGFDPNTGRLAGTPGDDDGGVHAGIVISVSDGRSVVELPEFSIAVTLVNEPPTISGAPDGQVTAGASYAFVPSAMDPDGDDLMFSIQNEPGWATFNPSTGRLAGTPGDGAAGTYSNIVIGVSDGEETDSLPAFSITVTAAANGAPTISGDADPAVTVGQAYAFEPNADDPDGDDLTFSIDNAPSWADFDEQTGGLSGTPQAGDVGTYSNIEISVSDGDTTASLQAFSITVNAIALGSATLSWVPPTQNTDGSALNDLDAYTVHWGRQSGSYSSSVELDAGLTRYVVDNLGAGTWYFATRACNSSGTCSNFSNEASKTIQ